MSYTLRGRLQTRLAGALVPFFAACALAAALGEWWPVQLAGVMTAVGLGFDAVLWHRLLPYQPGWAAVPMGLVELWATALAAGWLRVDVPGTAGLWFFGGAWILAQVTGQAVLPLLHLSYAEDGGELGRGGALLSASAPVAVVAVLGVAWATQPPTVRLAAGVHEGPLLLDHSQRLVGEPGTIVRGGIVIRSDDVTVSDVTVVGGTTGIEVRDSENVRLERVRVAATRGGIMARQSSVTIRDCAIDSPSVPGAQGIDISFAMYLPPSSVRGCVVRGGDEGIVSHLAHVDFSDNEVSGTGLRGIVVTEMSMGTIDDNVVRDSLGIGIFCGDYSHCEIADNRVEGTRPDPAGGRSRAGWDIVSHYYAHATVEGNRLERGAASFIGASIDRDD
jgi:hypothetical protein